MELRAIPALMGKKYFIPNYQRGFRWENDQVKRLLDDLEVYANNTNEKGFYCLQPIVVKHCPTERAPNGEKDWYEVVDGQQRLTTIRILCAIFDSLDNMPGHHRFDIHYETRPDMDGIFDTLEAVYDRATRRFSLTQNGKKWDNLDSVYIYHASETAVEWFNAEFSRKSTFGTFFFNDRTPTPNNPGKKSVQVIWYEDYREKDARDLFNEINDMTVRLSCSELIRSLLLSANANYHSPLGDRLHDLDGHTRQQLVEQDKRNWQRYVNTRWDEIEHLLSAPKMQAFITNRSVGEVKQIRNKIELLFDLMAGKNTGGDTAKRDPLYTFLWFGEQIADNDAARVWEWVEQSFSRLRSWMEDRDYYHTIGYLTTIGEGDKTLSELLDYAAKHSKIEVQSEVARRIRKSLDGKRLDALEALDYTKDYDYIRRLLFLYNVELTRQMKACEHFEFEQFKPLKEWTLEHIHAQNSECLPHDDRKVWAEWAHDNAETLKVIACDKKLEDDKAKLIDSLETAATKFQQKKTPGYTHETVKELFDEVVGFYRRLNGNKVEVEPVHQLSNLTLLKGVDNTSIGCSAFAVKRHYIVTERNKGTYFPIGTLNVFNKVYSDNQWLFDWSYGDDRPGYFESIKQILAQYFSNPK